MINQNQSWSLNDLIKVSSGKLCQDAFCRKRSSSPGRQLRKQRLHEALKCWAPAVSQGWSASKGSKHGCGCATLAQQLKSCHLDWTATWYYLLPISLDVLDCTGLCCCPSTPNVETIWISSTDLAWWSVALFTDSSRESGGARAEWVSPSPLPCIWSAREKIARPMPHLHLKQPLPTPPKIP